MYKFDWTYQTMNDSDEVKRLVYQKYGMISIKKHCIQSGGKLVVTFCYQQYLMELTKQWMRVMKNEGEYIKNME